MRSGFKLGTFLSLCIAAAMASCGSDEPSPSQESPAVTMCGGAVTSACCGNQVLDPGEACDGPAGLQTCAMATSGAMANGLVSCRPDCTAMDLSACTSGVSMGGGMNP